MPIDSNIREIILQNGYITVDEMMRKVLSSEPTSYYQSQNNLGSEGDFTTSPEISQLFGEIIGLWCTQQWQNLGSPPRINLVELGAGRGLLMRDILRVARLVPEFYKALQIELVEINPHFIKHQQDNLAQFDVDKKWLSKITNITKKIPTIIIANEFFDALPIKQYVKEKDSWTEVNLVIDPTDSKIKFSKIKVHNELQTYLLQTYSAAADGAVLEESKEAWQVMRFIAKHLQQYKGSGLIIDYGYYIPAFKRTRYQYNSTLQAIKAHKYHPLLETLGEADLSAHVDFYYLEQALKSISKLELYPIITSQRDFLIEYGILLRSNLLKAKLCLKQAELIERQVERLISPKQMGSLFQVMQFCLY